MRDINNMELFEFERLTSFLVDKNKGTSGKFHGLSMKQKRMIEEAKKNG